MQPQILIVGLGPGGISSLPLENLKIMENAGRALFLRTGQHPAADELKDRGITFRTFDHYYDQFDSFQEVYIRIAQDLLDRTGETQVVYAVPGHPLVAEESVGILMDLCRERGVKFRTVPAMSFLDSIFSLLALDPGRGLHIIDALQVDTNRPDPALTNIVLQVYNNLVAGDTKLTLMDYYPDEHPITVIRAAGVEDQEKLTEIPLYELDRLSWIDHLTTVVVPPYNEAVAGISRFPADRLVDIMEQLRDEKGCPWDREQTHETLRKYLVEETYEVIDAIDEGNMYKICEELGDLLLQIAFHAQMAREEGFFDFNDIVREISEKLIRRHPHVFGKVKVQSSSQVSVNWDQIKGEEKTARGETQNSLLDGVPSGLPALAKAEKIQKKAAKVGFDWPDYQGALTKVEEELTEFKVALASGEHSTIIDELGDTFFALVNVARLLGIETEAALNGTSRKFGLRFRLMEESAQKRSITLKDLSLEELDKLWEEAKISLNNKNITK